jgi:hypothetical protein
MTPPLRRFARSQYRVSSRVLVTVDNAQDDLAVGAGSARLAIRTLDRVSVAVRARELLVLRGGVASGARALARVLAGVRTPRAGVRHLAPRVQMRYGCIDQADWLQLRDAWSARGIAEPGPARDAVRHAPVVYVLRVRGVSARDARTANVRTARAARTPVDWVTWCASVRARGGAVVVQLPWTVDVEDSERAKDVSERSAPTQPASSIAAPPIRTAREPGAVPYAVSHHAPIRLQHAAPHASPVATPRPTRSLSPVRERTSVRELTFDAGRVVPSAPAPAPVAQRTALAGTVDG